MKKHGNQLSSFGNAKPIVYLMHEAVGKYPSDLLAMYELLFILHSEDKQNLQTSQVCLHYDPINSHIILNNHFFCI